MLLAGAAGVRVAEDTESWKTDDVSNVDRFRPASRPTKLDHLSGERSDVDLHKDRGLDLTPTERARRRSNRRWMLAVACGSILILGAALGVSAIEASKAPNGPQITVPTGYKAVRDGYFTYAVPSSWSTNPAFTDQAGDVETSGSSGWAGQHISYLLHAPSASAAVPVAVDSFGQSSPASLTLTGGRLIDVKGASVAFEYQANRPNGFHAVLVHAWASRTDVELWLLVHAPQGQTKEILASLVG